MAKEKEIIKDPDHGPPIKDTHETPGDNLGVDVTTETPETITATTDTTEKLVMTAKEKKEEEEKKKPKEKKKKEIVKKVEKRDMVFECPYAPMGKSSTTIECQIQKKGQTTTIKYPITLLNRRFTIPADMPEEEKKKLIHCLKENNFEDVTAGVKKGVVYVKEKNKYMYYAVHPAHTEKHPMNGNISLVLKDDTGEDVKDNDGKQITKQLVIKDGTCETDEKKIYQLLLKSGFFPGGKEVIHD